ncbi:hypothetical protein BaRGS_00040474 [Batillaria attramentaria]|uniref:Novel STAND NTPase 3 domain-containing protein n=1 Tax=Batillaria attramentaria TaxID=370345 RepID=A0ABD0J072_9CAEN
MEQDKKFMFNYNTYDTARNLLEQEGVVVIMGPEKCGKTTIGRALQRHFRKDYISLHLEGRDSLKRCRRVSGKRIVLLDEVFMFSETLIDVALWSQVFKSMQKSGCLVIVIIKTVTNPEDVQHNLPHFLDKCPKISVATYLKDELFQCCEKGGLKDLKGLVCHGADVNVVNEKGESPLHIACTRGRVDIVKQLLEVKANPDVQNRQGQTPLHYACSRDVATNVTLDTTDSTTNIDKVDDDPSMHAATQFSDETITTQCVESYFKDEKPDTSAHDETKDQHNRVAVQHDKITRLLLNAGADPEAEDNTGHTPLHVACHKGNRAVVASLLSRSPNPDVQLSKSPNLDVQDRDGATALHMACERGDYAIVSLLIMAGANKEAEDKKHTRALHVACRNGHTDIIKHLLGSHCDKEARDEQQWTPLHWACENGKEAAVSLLLEAGANIEAEDKSGFRPLHVASGHGNDKIVQVLLGRGASVKAKTSNGEKASDLAKRLGHQKVVKLFK